MLDGGTNATIKGPNGSLTLSGPSENLSIISAAGTFLVPGDFTVSGAGGKDVGPFSATVTIPNLPALVSPANASNLTVTRSSGMTVTWKGGSGNVNFGVSSALDNTNTTGSSAVCTVPGSPGTFTIPPYVLLALPAGNFSFFGFSSAQVDAPFTATGINAGILHAQIAGPGFGGFTLK